MCSAAARRRSYVSSSRSMRRCNGMSRALACSAISASAASAASASHVPARLARFLHDAGHGMIHTSELPEVNRRTGLRIAELADGGVRCHRHP